MDMHSLSMKRNFHIKGNLSRAEIRKVLSRALTAAELDSFCCVSFPDVFRNFSSGMEVIERQTHLIESREPSEILKNLYEYVPDKVEDALEELRYFASDQFAFLSDKIQRLSNEKDALEQKILSLKLQRRRGDQLLARETLSADRFLLIDLLAVGPISSTWRAFDQSREIDVAIRILQPRFSKDKARIRQFFQNQWCQADIKHPHVARIVQEPIEEAGIYYSVIEFANQGDLERGMNNNWISKKLGLKLLEQVSKAMDFCHKQNIFHLDIKPTNILVNENETGLISDFDFYRVKANTISGYDPDITHRFSAPELQRDDGQASPRSDVYSLCMVILFVLYGKHFFENMEDGVENFFAKLLLKDEHRKILYSARARDPRQRPDTLTDLIRELSGNFANFDVEPKRAN